jgi:PAS domain S-box-containing protein
MLDEIGRLSTGARYALAAALTVIGGGLAYLLLEAGVRNDVVALILPCAAFGSASLGGRGPGVLAVALAIVGSALLIFPPLGSLWVDTARDRGSLAIQTTACVMLGWSVGFLQHRSRVHSAVAEAVARSEHQYRVLFESNPEPMFIVDVHTRRIVSANEAASACYGYSRSELLSMKTLDLVFPEDVPMSLANVEKAPPPESRDLFKPVTWRTHNKAGATVYVDVTACRIPLGSRECAILAVRNVTDNVLAMQSLRRAEMYWRALLQNANECFLVAGMDDRILFSSCALAGFGPGALRDRSIVDLVLPDDAPALRAQRERAVKDGVAPRIDVRLRAADGQVAPHESRCLPIKENGAAVRMFLFVFTDVTKRREQEHQLSVAKEAAEEASRAKDRFIAALSHELRTPLTSVLAAVSLARDRSPESAPFLDLIRRNVEIEAHLIDDLLDVSRLITGKLTFEPRPVDMHAILSHVIEVCRPDAESKEHDLVFDLGATESCVSVDPVRIEQALWNIVQNAVKFTPPRGKITVSSTSSDGRLVVKVCNSGSGISKEDLARIFCPFEQATGAGKERGLGLGLAISKGIVDTAGGTLSAESAGPGAGACFTMELPIHAAPPSRPTPPPRDGGPVRILLVEDDVDTALTVSEVLRASNYDVETADSEASALEAFRSSSFDVVISDIGLPDGSGLDLLPKLAAIHPVHAIALSGYGMEEDVQRSRAAGFEKHLTKPITCEKLVAAVHDVTA